MSDTEADEETFEIRDGFSLSISNKIGVTFVFIGCALVFLVGEEWGSYQMGETIGLLMFSLVIPMCIGWFAWRQSGRKLYSGSTAFNVALGVMVLLLFGAEITKRERMRSEERMAFIDDSLNEFKRKVLASDDSDSVEDAYDEYASGFIGGIDDLADLSVGKEKQFYQLMGDFSRKSKGIVVGWSGKYDAVQSDEFMAWYKVKTNEEFEIRKQLLIDYSNSTIEYRAYVGGMIKHLKNHLSVLGPNNKMAIDAVKGASEVYDRQKGVLSKVIASHLSFGNIMDRMISFLHENKDSWDFDEGMISFNDEVKRVSYNSMMQEYEDISTLIQKLSLELMQSM